MQNIENQTVYEVLSYMKVFNNKIHFDSFADSEKHDSHFTFSEGFTIKHLDFYLTSATIMYASKAYSFNRSVPPVFLHQFQKDRFQSLANQNTFSNHEDNHTRATYLVLQNKDKSRRE